MTKLIQCNVATKNIAKSLDFYSMLFPALPFARSLADGIESYHQPISSDGIQLTISQQQADGEQIICYFAVDDLDATIKTLEQAGGSVLVAPFTLPIAVAVKAEYDNQVKQNHPEVTQLQDDVGRSAILQDPDGNLFGLTELQPQAHSLFNYGKFSTPITVAQQAQHQRGIDLGKKVGHKP